MAHWSFEDNTRSGKGYCRILLDGQDVCIDVFPYRKGADPEAVKAMAAGVVELLNAAFHWRFAGDGLGPERLEDAIDNVNNMGAAPSGPSTL